MQARLSVATTAGVSSKTRDAIAGALRAVDVALAPTSVASLTDALTFVLAARRCTETPDVVGARVRAARDGEAEPLRLPDTTTSAAAVSTPSCTEQLASSSSNGTALLNRMLLTASRTAAGVSGASGSAAARSRARSVACTRARLSSRAFLIKDIWAAARRRLSNHRSVARVAASTRNPPTAAAPINPPGVAASGAAMAVAADPASSSTVDRLKTGLGVRIRDDLVDADADADTEMLADGLGVSQDKPDVLAEGEGDTDGDAVAVFDGLVDADAVVDTDADGVEEGVATTSCRLRGAKTWGPAETLTTRLQL
jgi:hypothetical protein